jgi:hypothetical protein
MAFYGRQPAGRARRDARERENVRMRCEKHGWYNPMQRTLGGRWVLGPCQGCAADRYEATIRRWAEEREATSDRPAP